MALKILDAGTLRTIKTLYIRQSGVMRRIRTMKVMDGGTLRTVAVFADPMTVSANGTSQTSSSGTITAGPVAANVSGGFAPYAYAWVLETNLSGAPSTANSPTLASTTFTKTSVPPSSEQSDLWRVTVTDALGDTASDTCLINFIRT